MLQRSCSEATFETDKVDSDLFQPRWSAVSRNCRQSASNAALLALAAMLGSVCAAIDVAPRVRSEVAATDAASNPLKRARSIASASFPYPWAVVECDCPRLQLTPRRAKGLSRAAPKALPVTTTYAYVVMRVVRSG